MRTDGVHTRINSSKPRRSGYKRRQQTESDATDTEDDVADDTSGNNVAEQAVQLLTGLLSKGGTFISDDRPKRKLSSMSITELDREQKITSIQLARIEMRKIQESIKKYENLNDGFDVVVEATKEMMNASKTQLASCNTFKIV